jgi:hypothetical protein
MFILTEGGKSTYSARDDGSALWVQDLVGVLMHT